MILCSHTSYFHASLPALLLLLLLLCGANSPSMDPNRTSDSPPNSLSGATHLSRRELLRRRLQHVNQLSQHYRELYWTLIHQLYTLYTQYPLSPFEDEDEDEDEDDSIPPPNPCAFQGCTSNAMAMTSFCHLHILNDPRQVLYEPCTYLMPHSHSGENGPITCGKPMTRSTVPPFCREHFKEAQMHLTRTLQMMTGLNISSSHTTAPKFHNIVTEFVRHIQLKRQNQLKEENTPTVVDKNEKDDIAQVGENM